LQEHRARTGFFEPDEFSAVLAGLPDDLQAAFAVAFITGWRVKSEILTRQWAHVDFHSGWLRLEPGETKNAEGRQVAGHLSCDPGQKVQMPSAKLWPSDHSGSIRSLAHGL
jgi:integrase